MKSFSTNFDTVKERIRLCYRLDITWSNGTTSTYYSHGSSYTSHIDTVGTVEAMITDDNREAVSTLEMVLFDYDGAFAAKFNALNMFKQKAYLYVEVISATWKADLDAKNNLLFAGVIETPISYNINSKKVSITIDSVASASNELYIDTQAVDDQYHVTGPYPLTTYDRFVKEAKLLSEWSAQVLKATSDYDPAKYDDVITHDYQTTKTKRGTINVGGTNTDYVGHNYIHAWGLFPAPQAGWKADIQIYGSGSFATYTFTGLNELIPDGGNTYKCWIQEIAQRCFQSVPEMYTETLTDDPDTVFGTKYFTVDRDDYIPAAPLYCIDIKSGKVFQLTNYTISGGKVTFTSKFNTFIPEGSIICTSQVLGGAAYLTNWYPVTSTLFFESEFKSSGNKTLTQCRTQGLDTSPGQTYMSVTEPKVLKMDDYSFHDPYGLTGWGFSGYALSSVISSIIAYMSGYSFGGCDASTYGFLYSDTGRELFDTLRQVAWEHRCALLISQSKVISFKFLAGGVSSSVASFDETNIDFGSLEVTSTESTDIKTKLKITSYSEFTDYVQNYAKSIGAVGKSTLTYENNISLYGEIEESEIEAISCSENTAGSAMATCIQFWGYRKSNIWKHLKFKTYLNAFALEPFDVVRLDIDDDVAIGLVDPTGYINHPIIRGRVNHPYVTAKVNRPITSGNVNKPNVTLHVNHPGASGNVGNMVASGNINKSASGNIRHTDGYAAGATELDVYQFTAAESLYSDYTRVVIGANTYNITGFTLDGSSQINHITISPGLASLVTDYHLITISGYATGATVLGCNGFTSAETDVLDGALCLITGDSTVHTISSHTETSNLATSITVTPALGANVAHNAAIVVGGYKSGTTTTIAFTTGSFTPTELNSINGSECTICGETYIIDSHTTTTITLDSNLTADTPSNSEIIVSAGYPAGATVIYTDYIVSLNDDSRCVIVGDSTNHTISAHTTYTITLGEPLDAPVADNATITASGYEIGATVIACDGFVSGEIIDSSACTVNGVSYTIASHSGTTSITLSSGLSAYVPDNAVITIGISGYDVGATSILYDTKVGTIANGMACHFEGDANDYEIESFTYNTIVLTSGLLQAAPDNTNINIDVSGCLAGATTIPCDGLTGTIVNGETVVFTGHATTYTIQSHVGSTSMVISPALTDNVTDNEFFDIGISGYQAGATVIAYRSMTGGFINGTTCTIGGNTYTILSHTPSAMTLTSGLLGRVYDGDTIVVAAATYARVVSTKFYPEDNTIDLEVELPVRVGSTVVDNAYWTGPA